jgi:iron complex transport system ATP-binding protein
MYEVICQLARSGRGLLVAEHTLELARRFADRVLVLREGRIEACAPATTALAPSVVREVFGVEAIENGALGFALTKQAGR